MTVIFDNAKVLELVQQWKETEDANCYEQILNASLPLIRSIVFSKYNVPIKEDLIQECLAAMYKVVRRFNIKRSSNLYGYIVRMVHNTSITYISKTKREYTTPDLVVVNQEILFLDDSDDVLEQLIIRNRRRFPSLHCIVDDATELVYYTLKQGSKRGIVSSLMDTCGMSRVIATVVYHSTLIHLRKSLHKRVNIPEREHDIELTLMPDLLEIIDEECRERIMVLFSGMYVKFP